MKSLLVAFNTVLCVVLGQRVPERDYENRRYFVVELDVSQSSKALDEFISRYTGQYRFEHPLHGLEDHFIFSVERNHSHNAFLGGYHSDGATLIRREAGFEDEYDQLVSLRGLRAIHMMEPKTLTKRMPVPVKHEDMEEREFKAVDSSQIPLEEASKKLHIDDPIFGEQWHLINSRFPGNDVNVSGLWYENITGKGIVAAIVDDGLEYMSPDLADNFNKEGSWDFNDNTALPKPRLADDHHGTRCAGEIAAVRNEFCGLGVAYNSQVSGIRILSGRITSADEAASIIYGLKTNDIYSCSWGPSDDGKTLYQPDLIVKKAFVKGIQEGRDKKGALYVFASGNGGSLGDSCNFDGYTNSIYSITVGAIDYKNMHPAYSEACSAVMAVTYSSGSGEHIHTTDIKNRCSSIHGGTSAAAPLAAGIYALVLQANPELTWRDVQHISVLSSIPVNEDDGDYQVTALGRKYSHRYGYGKIDAYRLAKLAQKWKNVNPQAWYYSDVQAIHETNDNGKKKSIKRTLNVTRQDLDIVNLKTVEHVNVFVNIDATIRGKVGVKLTSPFGAVSELAPFRPFDKSRAGFKDWTFMSLAHWGEDGAGEWTIEVYSDDVTGRTDIEFKDWQLKLFGEALVSEKAEKFDITKDYASERRDKLRAQDQSSIGIDDPHSSKAPISTISTSSTQITSQSTTTIPQTTGQSRIIKGSSTIVSSEATVSGDEGKEHDHEEGKNKQYVGSHTGQYLMALVVLGFIVVVFYMKFQKGAGSRSRRRRDEYEFDIIPGEDYSDSEDDATEDLLDLGRNSRTRPSYDTRADADRDRLFDELHADSLPDYDEEMFRIGDEEDDAMMKNDELARNKDPNQSALPANSKDNKNDSEGKKDKKVVNTDEHDPNQAL